MPTTASSTYHQDRTALRETRAPKWTTTELRRVPDLKILKSGHLSLDRPTAYFAAVIRDNAVTARDAGKAEPTGCRTYPYLVVTR